jgi:hypothetical protein
VRRCGPDGLAEGDVQEDAATARMVAYLCMMAAPAGAVSSVSAPKRAKRMSAAAATTSRTAKSSQNVQTRESACKINSAGLSMLS